MAINLNRATIIGRLGAEPESRGQNNEILALSVATSESWKDKQTGDWQERTQWHKVVIFNTHVAQKVSSTARKGDLVCVEGQIETRKWAAPEGDRYITEIVVKQFGGNVQVLPKDGNRGASEPDERREPEKVKPEPAPRQSARSRADDDDEIPF